MIFLIINAHYFTNGTQIILAIDAENSDELAAKKLATMADDPIYLCTERFNKEQNSQRQQLHQAVYPASRVAYFCALIVRADIIIVSSRTKMERHRTIHRASTHVIVGKFEWFHLAVSSRI